MIVEGGCTGGIRFDLECICDCRDNQDRHVLAECPNRSPLALVADVGGDWCFYWLVFWYEVGMEILAQRAIQRARQ
jgi:hypothetical protein